MAFFQSLFPMIVQKLWELEFEIYHATQRGEMEYIQCLSKFRDLVRDVGLEFNEVLHKIDEQICFFGNNDNDLPENPTILEIRKMWNTLLQKEILSRDECQTRTKRDEDRFTFFAHVEKFLMDIKKARAFIAARNKKTKQNEELARRIASPPSIEEDKEEKEHKSKKNGS